MKKKVLLLALFLTFLFVNVFSQTVYITNTGAKYHKEGCRYLSKSKVAINLSDAISQGYGACKVCKPPTSSSNSTTEKVKATGVKGQCKAITAAGTQCKRSASEGSDYCWQHQEYSGSKATVKSSGSSSGSSTGSGRTIQTGPRGGKYYINKNGNKTYIKK